MKSEILLAIAWTSLCLGERLQRSTVLTDESKRILEHFDFSNFDKQEALNYIDRQRYENQIRGKRSHTKFKGYDGKRETFSDKDIKKFDFPKGIDSVFYEKIPNVGKFINKRHDQSKKKRKSKKNNYVEQRSAYDDYDEDKEERRLWKRRRRKRRRHYWDHWSEWGPCSVTCGRGRKIRWRKCIVKNCTKGEVEMGEKTCQLPACNLLTKLLGI